MLDTSYTRAGTDDGAGHWSPVHCCGHETAELSRVRVSELLSRQHGIINYQILCRRYNIQICDVS